MLVYGCSHQHSISSETHEGLRFWQPCRRCTLLCPCNMQDWHKVFAAEKARKQAVVPLRKNRRTELQGEVHKLIAATRFRVVTHKLRCLAWPLPSMPQLELSRCHRWLMRQPMRLPACDKPAPYGVHVLML
jgi:hypothetical protein